MTGQPNTGHSGGYFMWNIITAGSSALIKGIGTCLANIYLLVFKTSMAALLADLNNQREQVSLGGERPAVA